MSKFEQAAYLGENGGAVSLECDRPWGEKIIRWRAKSLRPELRFTSSISKAVIRGRNTVGRLRIFGAGGPQGASKGRAAWRVVRLLPGELALDQGDLHRAFWCHLLGNQCINLSVRTKLDLFGRERVAELAQGLSQCIEVTC